MISTHDTSLHKRIGDELKNRGIHFSGPDRAISYDFHNFMENFLNNLFSYPYLDMSFLRYEDEILYIKEGHSTLAVFGVCDAGMFCIKDNASVVLMTDAGEEQFVAHSTSDFVLMFLELVHFSTMDSIMLAMADDASSHASKNIHVNLRETLMWKHQTISPFWEDVCCAFEERDAAPYRRLLTYLRDGKIPNLP